MIGTLDLYSLKLSPDNTMFFANKEEQTEWFDNKRAKSIENISFNGSRPFRFSSNYLEATFMKYNYCRYKFGNRYVYAFIENIIFGNDNMCELVVSIDMTQTFFEELKTAIAKSNVCNTTEKDSYFSTYKPFTNKMAPSDFNSYNLGCLSKSNYADWIGGFMLVNIDPKIKNASSATDVAYGLTDNGVPSSVMCIALPIKYNKTTKTLQAPQQVYLGTSGSSLLVSGAGNLFSLLDKYASYIADGCIGITFEQLDPQLYWGGSDYIFYNTNNMQVIDLPEMTAWKWLIIQENSTSNKWTFDLKNYLTNIPLPLRRNPYVYIRVGNDSESIELNLLDFYNDEAVEETMILEIEQFTSCIYPFQTNLQFKYNGRPIADRNVMFNLTTTDPVPYSASAWQQYYSQNKATVNDGLATQQAYQSAQLRNNLGTSLVNTGINTIMGGVSWTKKLGQISARSFKTQQAQVGMFTEASQGVLGAVTQYANSKLEMQKDKALQQIGWNDIKSSPSSFSNVSSNISAKYRNGMQGIEVDIYIAKNIEDIKTYHKQFGYVVNRMQNTPFTEFKKHDNFDFISFNEVTLALELPQYIIGLLEEQLESGIRFWYNYDNFLNYDIENKEI